MSSYTTNLIDWSFNGIVKSDLHLINERLDSLSNTSYLAKLRLNNPIGLKVIRSYLEIYAIPVDLRYARWKLWLNSFPLTKEFKPNYVFEVKGLPTALFIYDVTPIIARDSRKNIHKLFIRNIGSTAIYLGYAQLIVELESNNAETHHVYAVKIDECKRSSPCLLKTARCGERGQSKSETIAKGFASSLPIKISLKSQGFARKFMSSAPILDILIQECVENAVEVLPEHESDSFHMLSYNSYSSSYPRPILETEASSEITDTGRVKLNITIRNVGDASAVDVLVVSLMHGNTLFVKKLDYVDSGSEVTLSELIDRPKESGFITVRTIWNEFGEVFFKDQKVRF